MEQIIKLDLKNIAGLKVKYELIIIKEMGHALIQANKLDVAIKLADDTIAKFKPTGKRLQEILLIKVAAYQNRSDTANMHKFLGKALKAAPETQTGQQIKRYLDNPSLQN